MSLHTLKKRIAKIERERTIATEPAEPVDPEREQYWKLLCSRAFINELCEKANALLDSMLPAHKEIVLKDCAEWYKWQTGEREPSPVFTFFWPKGETECFLPLLTASMDGTYNGPLSLPAVMIDFWWQSALKKGGHPYVSAVVCRACSYPIPIHSQFGYRKVSYTHSLADFELMRCPLCEGEAILTEDNLDFLVFGCARPESARLQEQRRAKFDFAYNKGKIQAWDLMFLIGSIIQHNAAVN